MLKKIAQNISNKYFEENVPLEKEIAKYASANSLNPHQIEDLTNRVNREVISTIQRGVPDGEVDPHFVFPTAKTASVIQILRPQQSSAVPTLPPSGKVVVTKMTEVNPELRDRSKENLIDFALNPETIPDKIVGLGVLSYLKNKLKEKVSRYNRMIINIDSLMMSLEKRASAKLLQGTPVEVIESLPVDLSHVIETVENEWHHKVAHMNEPFDLDFSDPLVKESYDFDAMNKIAEKMKEEISVEQDYIKRVEMIVNGRS